MSTSDRRPAPPRLSGQTMVGMGVVEGASARATVEREEPVTPPSGTDRDALRRADVSLLLQEIHAAAVKTDDKVERLEAKVDAAISDVRELAHTLRSSLAHTTTRDEALFSLLGLPEAVRKLGERQTMTQEAVRSLDARIGYPPSTENFARASVHDVTPEQLAELERDHKLGTGLWRFVMQLHLRAGRSVPLAAGVSGSGGALIGGLIVELAKTFF